MSAISRQAFPMCSERILKPLMQMNSASHPRRITLFSTRGSCTGRMRCGRAAESILTSPASEAFRYASFRTALRCRCSAGGRSWKLYGGIHTVRQGRSSRYGSSSRAIQRRCGSSSLPAGRAHCTASASMPDGTGRLTMRTCSGRKPQTASLSQGNTAATGYIPDSFCASCQGTSGFQGGLH